MSEMKPATVAENPDEVVTQARVRYFPMPLGAGTMALITLDNGKDHTRPSTFGPGGLASINDALDEIAARSDVAAVGVTGKPFVFAVGADLSAMSLVNDPAIISAFGKLGHDVLRRFGEFSIPTFAFVNGAAMGGGMELALHCDYRSVSADAAALSLPEVFLGLIPGWGGAWLLPNLVGPKRALEVIINNSMSQNKQLKPQQAVELGVMDVIFAPADFLEQSVLWAAGVLQGIVTVERAPIDRDSWDGVVDAAREQVDARVHGATRAPYIALDLVQAAKTNSRGEGFDAEDAALTDLVMSDPLRASLYAFDLVQKRAKRPVGVPDKSLARPVNKVGIVGAGLMASQLALLFARQLMVPVVMTDLDQERVDKGVGYAHAELDKLHAKGRLSADKCNRVKALITGTTDKSLFSDADFVIEAVFEQLDVKKVVFGQLEKVVRPDCILATNTSSLSVAEMAAELTHPERVVGFHFFNPVALMPLLEIARADKTDDSSLATAFAVGKGLKKSCVLVADRPAFVVNRLLNRFLGEIISCVDEGASFADADSAVHAMGLPMDPFVLVQMVGPAVAQHVAQTLNTHFPDRFHASEKMGKLVAAGLPGVWLWDAAGNKTVDPRVLEIFGDAPSTMTPDQIRGRALTAIAQEARIMLDEGVVAEPQDLDLCMILGAGWPFWLGGITPYLDREGYSDPRFLAKGIASVPA
ncbi:MAG: 3-hydroxyacyl-CoA dehydrogenase NAD-binding domain-containing protein [Candidatus Nanopelagicales bacterium]|nr:3-hydroxyacyl-CoA dehydrogenase NAD-binding domain-containing protein [Candidatus Nanopelagicales bacterium]